MSCSYNVMNQTINVSCQRSFAAVMDSTVSVINVRETPSPAYTKDEYDNTVKLSFQKAGEKTDPIKTNMPAFDRNNKTWENEKAELKWTKIIILFINIAAVLFCTGLLINQVLICLKR